MQMRALGFDNQASWTERIPSKKKLTASKRRFTTKMDSPGKHHTHQVPLHSDAINRRANAGESFQRHASNKE